MPGGNQIPARDGASDIPPVARVENRAGSLRAGAGSFGSAPNSHPSIPDHSPVSTEFQNSVLNDAADQTVVMIGVGGGVSLPFLFFHAAPIGARRSPSQPHKF